MKNENNRIIDEVTKRINVGEDNFIVDSWSIQKTSNEVVASKEITSPKFDIQVSGPYVNIDLEYRVTT